MSVGSGRSFILSLILATILFSGMQMYKQWIAATPLSIVFGGYLSSIYFMLILTAVGNLETALFGPSFQTKLFPEIFLCLGISVLAAALIHRICATTCILFSILTLYYMKKISQEANAAPAVPQATATTTRRKK